MAVERRVLSYAPPPRRSGVADGFRLVGGVVCVFTTLAGLGIIWWGVIALLELRVAPTGDRTFFLFVGSVICLIGLLFSGFSVRWLVNAIRPKRRPEIDRRTPAE